MIRPTQTPTTPTTITNTTNNTLSAEGTCEVVEPATHAPGIAKIDTLQTALIKLL